MVDRPASPESEHFERVAVEVLATCARLVSETLGQRAQRAGIVRELPALERVAALLWELRLVEVEPDVEVLDELRRDGLLAREPESYVHDVETEDATDPAWWLDAASELGDIPPSLRRAWSRDRTLVGAGSEAGDDSEAE